MKTLNTKLAVAALGLAMLATPALAQRPYQASQHQTQTQAPVADEVIVDGRVIGADPDANVRLELRRDAYQSEY
jgi:hypothetical protein